MLVVYTRVENLWFEDSNPRMDTWDGSLELASY